jgi:hypothetical protein
VPRVLDTQVASSANLKLSRAYFVLAREHGFPSWPRFKAYITRINNGRANLQRPFSTDISYFEDRAHGLLRTHVMACRHRCSRSKSFIHDSRKRQTMQCAPPNSRRTMHVCAGARTRFRLVGRFAAPHQITFIRPHRGAIHAGVSRSGSGRHGTIRNRAAPRSNAHQRARHQRQHAVEIWRQV